MSQAESNAQPRVRKPLLKPVIFSVLILVSGIVIGAGLTLILVPPKNAPDLPPGPEFMSERMIGRMVGELRLSPEQQEQLKPIVTKHMSAIDVVRTEAQPKIRQEIESMNEEILALLDDAQKQLWQDRIKRMQEGFRRMHRRGPGDDRRDRDELRRGPGPDDERRDSQRMGPGSDDPNRSRDEMRRPRRRMPDEMPPPEGVLPPGPQSPLNDNPPAPKPPAAPVIPSEQR
jgi:hypothetical protein